MKKFAGLFVGSGASRNIGLGFIPDRVVLRNITSDNIEVIEWSRIMASLAATGGGVLSAESTGVTHAKIAQASGVSVYVGGDKVTSATAANIIAASAIPAYAGDMRNKHTAGLVNGWTLGHAGNRTGNFNVEASDTYVKAGSRIMIDDAWYTIQAMTSNGEAANEVTLDRAALSGEIKKITFPYDLYNAPVGTVMPAGIVLAETAALNEDGELVYIEAECYGEAG
jgi:hypothetical protein